MYVPAPPAHLVQSASAQVTGSLQLVGSRLMYIYYIQMYAQMENKMAARTGLLQFIERTPDGSCTRTPGTGKETSYWGQK